MITIAWFVVLGSVAVAFILWAWFMIREYGWRTLLILVTMVVWAVAFLIALNYLMWDYFQ